jgi:hypothetical protein
MNFFKNLFGGKGKNPSPGPGPMPTRALQLTYVISPDHGHLFAQQFVEAVKKIEGLELDYSVNTLDFVDKFLQKFTDKGLSVNDFGETIFVAGSYVGQVMINNNGGHWIAESEANLPEGVTMTAIVVKLPNGNIADPIAKAFKRFHFGKGDDLRYFYHVFTSDGNGTGEH